MIQKFIEAGYEIVDFEQKADVYIITLSSHLKQQYRHKAILCPGGSVV